MIAVTVALIGVATFAVPVFVEMKMFDPRREGQDHIWNILKRVFATVVLLWCIAYLAGIPALGLLQNPLGAPLQLTILGCFFAIPISLGGCVFGRRRLSRSEEQ